MSALFDLDDLPTLEQAVQAGHAAIVSVEANAGEQWQQAALAHIVAIRPGETFLAEDLRAPIAAAGHVPHDWKALGSLMLRACSEGLVESAGYAPARTSHGSPKRLWKRLSNDRARGVNAPTTVREGGTRVPLPLGPLTRPPAPRAEHAS